MTPETGSASALGPELPGLQCLNLLGSGGYAEVYLYERERPRTRVAVKLMRADAMDDAKRRQFVAEADLMAALADHPYIVSVYDAGTAPDGRPYLVMQYYPSRDLAVRIAADPMSVQEALRYGVQLSSAVETAHRANVIHRDIKPSNILLDRYGQPGLSDFGIAGRPDSGEGEEEDEVGVSIPWSPPEVLTGASNGSVASDVYSLAATVWTLLVGRAPFEVPGGDNGRRAMATRIIHSKPPATGRGDVPTSLDRMLQQALAKDPSHRPQSALELARNFQRVEQEMRLARTEVFLLDHGGAAVAAKTPTQTPTDPARANSANSATITPRIQDPVDADATQRKAPRRVGPVQQPQQAPPALTPAAPEPRPPADPRASQPTQRRPALVAVEQEIPAEPRRASKRPLLAAAVALVLVVVGIAAALSGGGGKSTPREVGTITTKSAETGGGAVPDASSAPTDPSAVSGVTRGRDVVFSWPAVTGISSYSWSEAGGASHSTDATRVTVQRAPHGRTCIVVHSVEPGYPVSQGTQGCVN